MLEVDIEKTYGAFTLRAKFSAATPGVIAVFGRSGCGKTTLINILAGLTAADRGFVRVDAVSFCDSVQGTQLAAERRAVGYVFQDSRLFPHLDVRGNLLYGAKRARGRPSLIDFDEVIALLGLETLLRRRSHELSGGERQRVALGRALLAQPRLLLLDEPLASLDSAKREEVLPYLQALRDRLAVPMIYVSHQFDEVLQLATQLVLLDNGEVIASGELGEVCLHSTLRSIVGPDSVGAVLEGKVVAEADSAGLTRLAIGRAILQVDYPDALVGQQLRVQLLARDLILATAPPQALSVRNVIQGTVQRIAADGTGADLVTVDIGGADLLARITRAATRDLALRESLPVWVLVKSVSLRGHAFSVSGRAIANQ
jgi:molybdate transport system ATP-binding protein